MLLPLPCAVLQRRYSNAAREVANVHHGGARYSAKFSSAFSPRNLVQNHAFFLFYLLLSRPQRAFMPPSSAAMLWRRAQNLSRPPALPSCHASAHVLPRRLPVLTPRLPSCKMQPGGICHAEMPRPHAFCQCFAFWLKRYYVWLAGSKGQKEMSTRRWAGEELTIQHVLQIDAGYRREESKRLPACP